MKKLPLLFIFAIASIIVVSCSPGEDSAWDEYEDWRITNETWFAEQQNRTDADGSKYYTALVPAWDTSQCVLIHYLYNDVPFDSSYTNTAAYGDSLYRTQCNQVIQGWTVALENMRVGDSCEVVIPYTMAYGAQSSGLIKPYSALKFHIKLVDIPFYQIKD